MTRAVLLYLPVIHRGYLEFLRKHRDMNIECLLIGHEALKMLGIEADYILRKDYAIRGIPEETARAFVESLQFFRMVRILDPNQAEPATELVVPDEDVSVLATTRFFPTASVLFDGTLRLRYDRKGVARVDPVPENVAVTSEEAHRELMGRAEAEALKSHDWWLQVGALIARDGKPLFIAHNRPMPSSGITGALGDPRSIYSRGEGSDDTLAEHAERLLVSLAAYSGVSLAGTDAYVTHFPCVPCGASLAHAGVRRLFFKQGYSKLESASVLRAKDVEIIRIV